MAVRNKPPSHCYCESLGWEQSEREKSRDIVEVRSNQICVEQRRENLEKTQVCKEEEKKSNGS